MTEIRNHANVLSIESAVAGGSVALITTERGTFVRHDGNDSSRAEKIISVVGGILEEAGLTLPDLNMIASSTGPGSYSGIRIGLSTALGLASALKLPFIGVSVLEAMANAAEFTTPLIAAIPVGKNDVAWQPFEIKKEGARRAANQPVLMSSSSFVDNLKGFPDSTLFAHPDLVGLIAERIIESTTWIDAGNGLAEYVGRFAASQDGPASPPEPLYLRNSDAAVRGNAF